MTCLVLSWLPAITGAGLACVGIMTQLQGLHIIGCDRVTVAGLNEVRSLTRLRSLTLQRHNKVSFQDFMKLINSEDDRGRKKLCIGAMKLADSTIHSKDDAINFCQYLLTYVFSSWKSGSAADLSNVS